MDLRECLSYGGLKCNNHRQSKTFENQSFLLTFLFSVTNDEDIKANIFENTDIINDGQPKPHHLLIMIKTWAVEHIPYTPNQIHYQNLEAAIKKASH